MPRRLAVALGLGLLLAGCSGPWGLRRQPAPGLGLGGESRQDPAVSGNGLLLASVVERGGRSTVLLQDRRSGRVLPLPQLARQQPHRSPSLSWTGRYLALLVQQGPRRQAVISDRATGRLVPLFLPGAQELERLSLAPDARQISVEVVDGGQKRVEVFDLAGLLEPDQPPGLAVTGAGPSPR